MAFSATARRSDAHLEKKTVPSGGYVANQIVLAPSGRPGVVQSLVPTVEGDTVNVKTYGQFEVPAASGTLFAVGANVGYDATNGLAVAGGTGDYDLGTAALAKVSGELVVLVLFGQDRPPLERVIADPGDGEAIPVANSGHVEIVTAGAETRTLAAPSHVGQLLLISLKTDGGDCVITCATTVNQTGNNTLTLADAGDACTLVGKQNGSNVRWSVAHNDGVALSTV